jgi:hypothetical protein
VTSLFLFSDSNSQLQAKLSLKSQSSVRFVKRNSDTLMS